jgi:hypothetical protein
MAERIFGGIPGYPEGTYFESRAELSRAGVHRPTQAGISGTAREGADSIVVSGGYEDDKDLGSEITYTGAGGRDPETREQVADQTLTGVNKALHVSWEHGLPVRVIRGYSSPSPFAPKAGYRYDGLYQVVECREELGKSGYKVWRFYMKKLPEETGQVRPVPMKTSGSSQFSAKAGKTHSKKPTSTIAPKSSAGVTPVKTLSKPLVPPLPKFHVGQHVKHESFGEGHVLAVEPSGPSGEDQVVTVQFEQAGTKKVLASKANLQPA